MEITLEKQRAYLLRKLGKAINGYELIQENDNILIAVSGGKDSLILLELLALRLKFLPIKYNLKAVHIEVDNVPYKIDKQYLNALCKELNVPLTYHKMEIDLDENSGKSICFVCSWNRRKHLFKLTEEMGCNKLALGHHLDDALQTLFMNMTTHSNISSMPPSLKMNKGNFEIIRPLILCEEQELILYKKLCKIPEEKESCPFETKNKRDDYKEFVNKMINLNPNAKKNIFRSMGNIDIDYLPGKIKK